MNKIYRVSKEISEITGEKSSNIFLFINILIWTFLAFLVTLLIFFIVPGSLKGTGDILFCTMGYTGVIVGFFGGILYLYIND